MARFALSRAPLRGLQWCWARRSRWSGAPLRAMRVRTARPSRTKAVARSACASCTARSAHRRTRRTRRRSNARCQWTFGNDPCSPRGRCAECLPSLAAHMLLHAACRAGLRALCVELTRHTRLAYRSQVRTARPTPSACASSPARCACTRAPACAGLVLSDCQFQPSVTTGRAARTAGPDSHRRAACTADPATYRIANGAADAGRCHIPCAHATGIADADPRRNACCAAGPTTDGIGDSDPRRRLCAGAGSAAACRRRGRVGAA